MKTLKQMQEEAREEFDLRFPRPEWLKDELTDKHMPVASQKDIKDFLDSLISKFAHEVSEAMIVEERGSQEQCDRTTCGLYHWYDAWKEQRERRKKLLGNQEEK